MDIKSMHYEFKLKLDRIDTLSNPDFNVAEIDWLLNEAQLLFVKQRFTQNNNQRSGFETTQKRIDDLSTLVVKYPEQSGITPLNNSIDLSTLKFPYLFLLRGEVDVQLNPNCIKRVPLKYIQHDDLTEALKDPFTKSSLDYIIYTVGKTNNSNSSSIYLYSGDYTVTAVYPEYIKYPNRMSLGGYKFIDGVVTTTSNCELPEQVHSEIIDLAVQLASLNIQNPEYIQLKNAKIQIND